MKASINLGKVKLSISDAPNNVDIDLEDVKLEYEYEASELVELAELAFKYAEELFGNYTNKAEYPTDYEEYPYEYESRSMEDEAKDDLPF